MSDPFETPVNRTGYMALAGLRYSFPNDERTKLGFEYNYGSQYWFNFAQASDDIIAPKTNTRGTMLWRRTSLIASIAASSSRPTSSSTFMTIPVLDGTSAHPNC